MAEYDKLVPGSAELIRDEWVAEMRFRKRYAEKQLDLQFATVKRGQWLGFSTSIAVIVLGAVAVVYAPTSPNGPIITSVGLVSLIIAALYPRRGRGNAE